MSGVLIVDQTFDIPEESPSLIGVSAHIRIDMPASAAIRGAFAPVSGPTKATAIAISI